LGGDARGQGASGVGREQKNSLGRVEDLGRICHELDTAKDDDILVGLGGLVHHQTTSPGMKAPNVSNSSVILKSIAFGVG
jgi:hypothetical protein